MSGAVSDAEGKNNLPGWSLPRDSPRPRKKQGWECPTPTVQDWDDYKEWLKQQERKDELPAATQIFLADTSLLHYKDPDVQLPWIHRLKCELPRRVGRLSGELPVKASYIGFGTEDSPNLYDEFKHAMAQIGVVLCRQIHHPPNRFEIAHLEQSDLIFVGGGNRRRLWETLGTDLASNTVAEHVKWRYLQGAVVIAVGEAMTLLGDKSWYPLEGKGVVPFTGWKIFPHIVAPEAEGADLEDMVEQLGGAGVIIMGIHSGGGMIFNRDGLVEPVRGFASEYRWDWQSKSVKQALLIGPPRSTGLICPLYAAMRRQDGTSDDIGESCDVYAYSLSHEEEAEEEHLFEHFDSYNSWLTTEARDEVEQLKRSGNDAFKAGKADAANLKYEQARVLLKSSARRWSELTEETRRKLDSLEEPKKTSRLPSEQEKQSLGCKEDHRAATLLMSLLLNSCASHLLAHEQDQQRKASQAKAAAASADGGDVVAPVEPDGAGTGEQCTTLVEMRDNLVSAFRAANEALLLSGGHSAKAWYRRGVVFERMRDPRNAERDFEQALLRAPGDKSIMKRRDEVRGPAGQVAESMYYARHVELDAQEQRLKLEARRALLLRGSFTDTYQDDRGQFAVNQALARLVEGTLEEVDGRTTWVLPIPAAAEDAPHLHPHALWTWEFLVQRATGLKLLQLEDVDLGSGPLEWLCKGLRAHRELRTLRLIGAHLGPAGARMLRNVLAQSASLIEVALDRCALLDAGLGEIADGLSDNAGQLEVLSLRSNHLTSRRLGRLADALCAGDSSPGLLELDLSGNPLAVAGAKEVARIVGSDNHRLQIIRLQDCLLDLTAFWRIVGNLNDARPLSQLDLRINPIGRGTRRCWHSQMGPTIRCEVLLTDHPLKARKEAHRDVEEADTRGYPLSGRWM